MLSLVRSFVSVNIANIQTVLLLLL